MILILLAVVLTGALIGGIIFVLSGKNDDISSLTGLMVSKNPEMAKIEISAMEQGPYGIEVDSAFKLSSNMPLDQERVESALWIEPKTGFTVTMESDREFLIQLDKPLEEKQLLRIHYKKESEELGWAFQTIERFTATGNFPANGGIGVPIDTGIEIYFNQTAPEDIEKFFTINPKTEGRFEFQEDRVVFVADENLISGTNYVVEIGAGYGPQGEILSEAYHFRFETGYEGSGDANPIGFYDVGTIFRSDQPQVISLWSNAAATEEEQVQTKVYTLTSAADYGNAMDVLALRQYTDQPYKGVMEAVNYTRMTQWESQIRYVEDNGYKQYYLEMPERLADGFYLMEIATDDETIYHLVQVTPYQAYVAIDSDQLFCWVMDVRSQSAVSSCSIRLQGKEIGKTDGEGILMATLKDDLDLTQTWYCDGETETGEAFIIDLGRGYYEYYAQDKEDSIYTPGMDAKTNSYWSYLYTDRKVYLPTDQVQVFGFVQDREGNTVDELSVIISYNDVVLDETKVTVSDNGVYKCDLDLDNFLYYYATLTIKDADEIVAQESISVEPFEKPTYQIKTQLSADYVMSGDSIDLTAEMSFFEGTPVKNGTMTLYSSGYNGTLVPEGEVTLTCDENGQFDKTFVPMTTTENQDWQPNFIDITLQSNVYQKNYYGVHDGFIFFPKDGMIQMEINQNETDRIEVVGSVHAIDLERFTGEMYDSLSYQGAALDQKPITIEVKESYYEPVFEGQVYDYINKASVDRYRYEWREQIIDTQQLLTDAEGEVAYSFTRPDKNKSYSFKMTTTDQQGREIAIEESYWPISYPTAQYNDKYYTIHTDQEKYKLDELVDVGIYDDVAPVMDTPVDKMLYIKCKDGFMDYEVREDLNWSFAFDRELLSNAYVMGIYFDGYKMYQPYWGTLNYDYDEQELVVRVETDKLRYEPGDQVDLKVQVTDRDGNPVEAGINISVVDEAYFALFEDYDEPVSELYAYASGTGILRERLFGPSGMPGMGAEKGGEGDSYVRGEFENTAFFDTIETGLDGKGGSTFRLPDNLTSWRVTATAVSAQIKAGKGVATIESGLPFFLTEMAFEQYLADDEIMIGAASAGSGLDENSEVRYDLTLIGEAGEVISKEALGSGSEYINIPVGKLAQGNYRLKLSAKSGDYYDAIEKRIQVVTTRQYFHQTTQESLDNNMEIDSRGNPVKLIFTNKAAGEIFDNLYGISRYSDSKRIDLWTAAETARGYLNETFDAGLVAANLDDYDAYVRDDMFADMTYAEGNPETTAYVLLSDLYQKGQMDASVRARIVHGLMMAARSPLSTVDEQGAAMWALSIAGEPVLTEIYRLMDSQAYKVSDLNPTRLYVLLSLIELGDLEKAKVVLDETIDQYARNDGAKWALDPAAQRKENARLLMASSLLGRYAAADGLWQNLQKSEDRLFPTVWEQMTYWMAKKPVETVCSFSYALDDKIEKVSLDYNDSFALSLSGKQAEAIRFSDIVADVAVIKEGIGTAADIEKNEKIVVKRTYAYSGSNSPANQIEQGDMVDVTIEVACDSNIWAVEITDYLPAGLVFYNFETPENQYIAYDESGSRILFTVYKNEKTNKIKFTYTALAVAAGTYTADYITAKNMFGSETTYADQMTVVVK